MANPAASLQFTFAQVNTIHTLGGKELADNKQDAPKNLNLASQGVIGGIDAHSAMVNTVYNRPVPTKEASTPALA